MSLEELLRERLIEKIAPNRNFASRTFKLAERDLKSSKLMLENENYDWCLAIAYNAMLQAGRSLMFSKGYRPYTQYQHVAVVRFVHDVFGKDMTDRMITTFDRMRKKRHRIIYEEAEIVSEDEAKKAIEWAEEFVNRVGKILGVK